MSVVKRVKMASGVNVPPKLFEGAVVYDIAEPWAFGKILILGPEVSEIKWDDKAPHRNRYVGNHYLRVKE